MSNIGRLLAFDIYNGNVERAAVFNFWKEVQSKPEM